MQSVKVTKLVTDLAEGVGSVANGLTSDQVKTLEESKNLLFQLVALAVGAHNSADLSEEQTDELEKAVSALSSLDEQYSDKEMDLIVQSMTKGAAKIKAAKPADRGSLAMDLEATKAKALADLSTAFAIRRTEHETTVAELSNLKGLASVSAVQKRLKWKDTGSGEAHTRPEIAGNSWLMTDILTGNQHKLTGVGHLDKDGVYHFMPVGEDWRKNLARPFELVPDVWNEIGQLPTDKLGSATDVQGVQYRAIYTMPERKGKDDLLAYLTGLINNDNLDTGRIGGSRGVRHIVEEVQKPGFVRQILQSEFTEKYGLLEAERKAKEEAEKTAEKVA